MIDVTVENFEAEVIAASMQVPVLVDFWAPWCGPCKTLGPVLEKLEVAYGGRFKLVKINTEEEQQLAAMFGIRSIPTCYLMVGGQPVDGFAGALPCQKGKSAPSSTNICPAPTSCRPTPWTNKPTTPWPRATWRVRWSNYSTR